MLLKWFLTVLLIVGWLHTIYSIAELPWIIGKALENVVFAKKEEPIVYEKPLVCVTKQKDYGAITTCYTAVQDMMPAVEAGDTIVFRTGITYIIQNDKADFHNNVINNVSSNTFHNIAPVEESEGWPNSTDCPWDKEKQVRVCSYVNDNAPETVGELK